METLKNVMYAGIGLAHHTEDKMKEKLIKKLQKYLNLVHLEN